MNKTALIVFMFVVILACVFAYFGKVQQIKSEHEWKDSIMSGQISLVSDNMREHDALRQEIQLVRNTPQGVQRAEVEQIVRQMVGESSAGLYTQLMDALTNDLKVYAPTAYCVTEQDADRIRLDCRKLH